jgi:hypothetical protein
MKVGQLLLAEDTLHSSPSSFLKRLLEEHEVPAFSASAYIIMLVSHDHSCCSVVSCSGDWLSQKLLIFIVYR